MSYHQITKNGVDAAEPLSFPEKRITLSTTIQYRGRAITIAAEGYSLDQFVDLLDKRAPIACEARPETPAPAESAARCPHHPDRPLKPMKFADRQGHTKMCTARIGDDYCDFRA